MKNLFDKPTFKTIKTSKQGAHGEFVLSRLARGFGSTIGNSIRRTLISSLEGASPVAIKIAGVKHEFQTLAHVHEDVVKIILNLKNLVVNYEGDEPVTISLDIKASKAYTVTASDFVAPSHVEIVSLDLVIAHLEKGADFKMEVIIAKGRGYNIAIENKKYAQEFGAILMDANFSPIKLANFEVKEISTIKYGSLEKIIFNIKTNGAITAIKALEEASSILISYFMLLTQLKSLEEHSSVIQANFPQNELPKENIAVEHLFSTRACNALKKVGYLKLFDLSSLTKQQLYDIKGLGKVLSKEVEEKLTEQGIKIK